MGMGSEQTIKQSRKRGAGSGRGRNSNEDSRGEIVGFLWREDKGTPHEFCRIWRQRSDVDAGQSPGNRLLPSPTRRARGFNQRASRVSDSCSSRRT